MLAEEILPFVILLVGAVAIAAVATQRLRTRGRRRWTPSFENLHLLCIECEHELVAHATAPGRKCRGAPGALAAGTCRCRRSRRRAFADALTSFELAARREMLSE